MQTRPRQGPGPAARMEYMEALNLIHSLLVHIHVDAGFWAEQVRSDICKWSLAI